MTTNSELALEPVRHDTIEGAPSGVKSARPAASSADPLAAIAAAVDAQGAQIQQIARTVAVGTAASALHDRVKRAADELSKAVDERTRAQKSRRTPDPLIDARVSAINRDIDTTELARKAERQANEIKRLRQQMARPPGPSHTRSTQRSQPSAAALYRKAAIAYLRTGQDTYQGAHLRDLERKALSVGSAADGGVLIVPEYDTGPLERLMSIVSPMRQYATVRTISSASLQKPFNLTGTAATWVGDTEARPETAGPKVVLQEFPAKELAANPFTTQTMLDDALIDIEQWLAEEVNIAFAEAEGRAFISGDGNRQPYGLQFYPKVANANYNPVSDHGKFGYVATGAAGDFSSTAGVGFDTLVNMTMSIKAGYRAGASWVMNRGSIGKVRQLKDGQGRMIWEPSGKDGNPQMILNYPIAEMEDMPDFAADAYPIAFGDLKRTYIIVDRTGMRVLRDPYSSKPNVSFYTTKRVGGGATNFECMKFLKAAST